MISAMLATLWLAATMVVPSDDVPLPAPGGRQWRPLTFRNVPRATTYEPVMVDGEAAVRAVSECSASALYLPMSRDVDLADTPRLSWRWKIDRGLPIPDERVKRGDDFAARVYLVFEFDAARASLAARLRHRLAEGLYGERVPGAAINYVWASREPAGASWDNPYAGESKMISLGRGPSSGGWRTEDVDVADDHQRLFGSPPSRLLGVALMTDSDDSCQRADTSYAAFRFHGVPDRERAP
jgi:hypothetical protein